MSPLIQIPVGHMIFVPAHRKSDEASAHLSPAKWPVKFVLIANEKEREALLGHDLIQSILAPTI